MSTAIRELLRAVISADTDAFSRGLRDAQQNLSNFGGAVVAKAAKIGAAIGVALGGAALVKTFADNTLEYQKLLNRLQTSVTAASKVTAPELVKIAEGLEKVTTFDANATLEAIANVGKFTSVTGDAFRRTITVAQDLAAATGKDLNGAFELVAKTIQKPGEELDALKEIGILFTEEQKKTLAYMRETGHAAEAQGYLLDLLGGKFKGAAEKLRDSLPGQLEVLKNQFNDLLRADEGAPGLVEVLKDLNEFLPKLKGPIQTFYQGVAFVATAFIDAARAAKDFFAAFTQSKDAGQLIQGLERDIAFMQERLKSGLLPVGGRDILTENLEKARAKLVELKKEQAEAVPPPVTPDVGGNTPGRSQDEINAELEKWNKQRLASEKLAEKLKKDKAEVEKLVPQLEARLKTLRDNVRAEDLGNEQERMRQQYERTKQFVDLQNSLKTQEQLETESYLRRSEIIKRFAAENTQFQEQANAAQKKLDEQRRQQIVDSAALTLNTISTIFDSSATMLRDAGAEQTGIYKAMFAASKAFATAEAIIKINQAMAEAAATPFPANLGAVAKVAALTGSIISNIMATKLVFAGQAHEGMGYIPRTGSYVLEKGERVIKANQNADLTQYLRRTPPRAANDMTGNRQNIVNMNIYAQDAQSFKLSDRRIQQAARRAVY